MDDYYSYKRGLDDGRKEMLKALEDVATYVHNYIIISEEEEKKLLGFIDRKVNSPKTLSSNGEYLESISRKVNEVKGDKE